MSSRNPEECATSSELTQLQELLAKQHDDYLEMLQEPIDNAISATVSNETYFRNPEPMRIQLDFERRPDTVHTIIADEGSGMSRDIVRDVIFETGNKEESDGILNNMGAGLKASIAWCEHSLKETQGVSFLENPFHLLTRTAADEPIQRVDGPVSSGIQVYDSEDEALWEEGTSELTHLDHGTRVHMTAARDDFDDDVAAIASTLSMKISYLAEILGVRFRRLISAHDDNCIVITYRDIDEDGNVVEEKTLDVPAIEPIFEDEPGSDIGGVAEYESFEEFQEAIENLDIDEDAKYAWKATTLTDDLGVEYNISYEYGMLDLEATIEAVDMDDHRFIVTTQGSRDFRWRYQINSRRAGTDIYANGRVLDVAQWPYDVSRHNRFNGFVGILRIEPVTPEEHEVPTENDKTGIEKQSSLWRKVNEWLKQDELRPFEHEYPSQQDDEEQKNNEINEHDEDDREDKEPDDQDEEEQGVEENDDRSEEDEQDDKEQEDHEIDDNEDDRENGEADNQDEDESDDSDAIGEPSIEVVVDSLEEIVGEDAEITSEFDAGGATIDIVYHRADDSTELYKITQGDAIPEDVYDMMMYQDHFKRLEDESYVRTVLISEGMTDEAAEDLEKVLDREDEVGDPYQISQVSVEDGPEAMPWMNKAGDG